jgi:hypothetical protein
MAVSTRVLFQSRKKYHVRIWGVWDTADETDTVVVDKSTLLGPDGTEPGSIRVDEITWSIGAGYNYVTLEWDHTADDMIAILSGGGYVDYRPSGGANDPRSTGGTGDVVLTASGGAAGDVIDITLICTLKD